ncbi:hypothetical protein TNCV_3773121 [Trichonephila clavipes]|nr:hypothetical protein TNCV_3773121 [Trichonephila clavipes]
MGALQIMARVTNEGRKVCSGYLPFRTNASILPITLKRSSLHDVGTSSYRYHTTTHEKISLLGMNKIRKSKAAQARFNRGVKGNGGGFHAFRRKDATATIRGTSTTSTEPIL